MDRQLFRLYVDLSASQVRKRLKGYGLGVRKVESVDRGKAVVLHTATGEHLRRLETLLADVMGKPPDQLRDKDFTAEEDEETDESE